MDINLIRGTLGRKGLDFDHHFHPLTDRIRDRWVSVAKARKENIPLAAPRLIQIDGSYFVVDGHHRISVARALGESAIDAEVTVIDVEYPRSFSIPPSMTVSHPPICLPREENPPPEETGRGIPPLGGMPPDGPLFVPRCG